jgi:primosomal protein N' (replication factor Y)
MKIVHVALDVPLSQTFDYLAPDGDVEIGTRVLVPFGPRRMIGIVTRLAAQSSLPADRLKRVTRVLRETPALSDHDLRLLTFASEYYHYPLGQVVMNALPARLRRAESAPQGERKYVLTHIGKAQCVEDLPARAAVRRKLLAELQARGEVPTSAIAGIAKTARAALKAFEAAGWVEQRLSIEAAAPAHASAAVGGWPLNATQSSAVEAIRGAIGQFKAFLLYGVTGSGKTEVYLRVAEAVLERGEQVLMLVPEIALTPQLVGRFRSRFGAEVAVLHSGLKDRERLFHWQALRRGDVKISVGVRSAVFAPVDNLGLIVVDE